MTQSGALCKTFRWSKPGGTPGLIGAHHACRGGMLDSSCNSYVARGTWPTQLCPAPPCPGVCGRAPRNSSPTVCNQRQWHPPSATGHSIPQLIGPALHLQHCAQPLLADASSASSASSRNMVWDVCVCEKCVENPLHPRRMLHRAHRATPSCPRVLPLLPMPTNQEVPLGSALFQYTSLRPLAS